MLNRVNLYNLGRLEYKKCLNIQKHLINKILTDSEGNHDSLILVEHDPVYTIGIRRQKYPKEELDRLSKLAQVECTDRGGLITFHGPGQLVAYPILNLKRAHLNTSLKWYVRQLEQLVIDLCAREYGLETYRLCEVGYTGVWCQNKKIAAIGVHCKRYVTYHGLALNCDVDLKWFENIVPCGIEDKEVSSLSSILHRPIRIDDVMPAFRSTFEHLFKVNLEDVRIEDVEKIKLLN